MYRVCMKRTNKQCKKSPVSFPYEFKILVIVYESMYFMSELTSISPARDQTKTFFYFILAVSSFTQL